MIFKGNILSFASFSTQFSELKSQEVDTLTGIALSLNEGMVGADETLKNYETQIQYIYRLIEL